MITHYSRDGSAFVECGPSVQQVMLFGDTYSNNPEKADCGNCKARLTGSGQRPGSPPSGPVALAGTAKGPGAQGGPSDAVTARLDALNRLWSMLESRVLQMAPPRWIRVAYKGELTNENACYLGLQREKGRWRLVHGEGWSGKIHGWTPLAECPVEIRIQAVAGVPALLDEVRKTDTHFIPALDAALDVLRKAVDR